MKKMIRNPAEDGRNIGRVPEHNVGFAEERRSPIGASAFSLLVTLVRPLIRVLDSPGDLSLAWPYR